MYVYVCLCVWGEGGWGKYEVTDVETMLVLWCRETKGKGNGKGKEKGKGKGRRRERGKKKEEEEKYRGGKKGQ